MENSEQEFTVIHHYDNGSDSDEYILDFDSESYEPFNSKNDVLAEIILVTQHNILPYARYPGFDTCAFCLSELNNQYVFELPCDITHVFHRNCYMTCIFQKQSIACMTCNDVPATI